MPPFKRARLDPDSAGKADPAVLRIQRASFLSSLSRSVSPPLQNAPNAEIIDIANPVVPDRGVSFNPAQLVEVEQTRKGTSWPNATDDALYQNDLDQITHNNVSPVIVNSPRQKSRIPVARNAAD